MRDGSQAEALLCLDQGGHASRALVFTPQGEKLAEASRPLQTRVDGLRVELDAVELVAGMRAAIAEVSMQLPEGMRLRAGLATQRSNIACWRRDDGRPLAPVLSWQDRRAAELLAGLDLTQVHELTGLYANAHYGASKLAWCLREITAVAQAARQENLCLGPMASFLAQALCPGSVALADPANASRTLLYGLQTRDWDDGLCRHFGIERGWLPRCVPSRYAYGELALPMVSVPLQILTGDLSAAAFVHGIPQPDTAYITLGTGAFVQRLMPRRLDGEPRLLNGIVWHDGEKGWYSQEGTVNGAGSALSWFAAEEGMTETELFAQLGQWCMEVESPPLFLNGISGLGSPFWQAEFESEFIGEGGLAARAVAVVESIVFLLYENLLAMQKSLSPAKQLLLSGGLATLDGLCQRLADLSGLPVLRSAEEEGTARGLAYLLAGMPREWSAQIGQRFEPGENRPLLQRHHDWQQGLYKRCDYN